MTDREPRPEPLVEDAAATRREMREKWGARAAGWNQRRRESDGLLNELSEHLIELGEIAPGQRVLDVACGGGDPAFAIGEVIGPSGSVIAVDITEQMILAAQEFAQQHSVDNVDFRLIESELEINLPPASVDVVTCRCGLMLMPDPVAAAAAWRTFLKPGGRIVVSTWGPPEYCDFFTLLPRIAAKHLGRHRSPRPTSQFRLSTPEILSQTLERAGYRDIDARYYDQVMQTFPSAEAWWEETSWRGQGANLLKGLPPTALQAIQDDAIEFLNAEFADGPVEITNRVNLATAKNPG
ncbi:MAG TPA: methyltransferase domain-containing protein [Thermomicrobiaceae bacterium]|nr:methyltransferase domain-containing protein [Thermomicrobiaceae bacterium]